MKECNPPSVVDVSSLGLKSFSKIFECDFSFPRAGEYFLLLVECAVRNLSMEGLCNRNFKSSDRLFFYMAGKSLEESTVYCNELLKHAFKILVKARWHWRRVWLAIDYNDIEYSGVDPLMVHDAMMMRGIQYQHVKVLALRYHSYRSPWFQVHPRGVAGEYKRQG